MSHPAPAEEPLGPLMRWASRNPVSLFAMLFSMAMTATMMHPSLGSVVTFFLNGAVLLLLRLAAHHEGQRMERERARERPERPDEEGR